MASPSRSFSPNPRLIFHRKGWSTARCWKKRAFNPFPIGHGVAWRPIQWQATSVKRARASYPDGTLSRTNLSANPWHPRIGGTPWTNSLTFHRSRHPLSSPLGARCLHSMSFQRINEECCYCARSIKLRVRLGAMEDRPSEYSN